MNNTRRGVVKVSMKLLEDLLFNGCCRVERIIEDVDDLQCNTVSILVSGNDTLPLVEVGSRTPLVDCQITKENVKIEFIKR